MRAWRSSRENDLLRMIPLEIELGGESDRLSHTARPAVLLTHVMHTSRLVLAEKVKVADRVDDFVKSTSSPLENRPGLDLPTCRECECTQRFTKLLSSRIHSSVIDEMGLNMTGWIKMAARC